MLLLDHYKARHNILGLFLRLLGHDYIQLGHCFLQSRLSGLCFLQRWLGAPRKVVHDGLVNTFAGLARVESLAFRAQFPAHDQREAHASFVIVDLALVALRILH